MLSAMNYEDHFRDSDHGRSRLDDDEDLSDDHYHHSFSSHRDFHDSNIDETPDIASEVTVGKDIDNKYEMKKELKVMRSNSPKPKSEMQQMCDLQVATPPLSNSKMSLIPNPTWTTWARQQRGRRRSSSSPSVGSSGRKKYICEKCNDPFSKSSDLRIHRDTMHAGEKKYKCKDCGKLFSQKGSLNRHMAQVPHGEFKYRCPRCGRIFLYKEYLMTHLKFSIHCVKNPTYEEPPAHSASSFLSSLSDSGEPSYSTATYRSGPPGLYPNFPRHRMYSKPPPGLRIPHS